MGEIAKPQRNVKKIIAHEWLVFLVWFAVGLLVLPTVLITVINGIAGHGVNLSDRLFGQSGFYPSLLGTSSLGGAYRMLAWVIVLGPYLLFQVARSITWSIRTIRTKES